MAAAIRSWLKDRLTRYEAKNKVDLPPSPGAEVQVEKWLTYESPYWARVCDREHSIIIRVSDEAAQKFFDQYELACTTLLRGIISITPFQPIIVRLRPGGEPQLALDVKGFNTKMMGGDVLYFQSTKELALEPWARDWSRRIAHAHPKLSSGVVHGGQTKNTETSPTSTALAISQKPLRLPDESRVNFLELGWCLIRPDQQEILDRDFPDPPVPAKYAHLFPGCTVIPESFASTSAPAARPRTDPLHLDDDEGSDDELAIKAPPNRTKTLKRPASPATGATPAGRGASSSPPPAERVPQGSSQSHTVTNSSPSHFSASLDQHDPRPVKRARTSLGAAPQSSKVLVAASDSDVQSQESRLASQAQSSGSGGAQASNGSNETGQTTHSSAAADLRGYTALTASTMDEPPFTLAQHNISLLPDTASTSTPDDDSRRQQPFLSLDKDSALLPSSSAVHPAALQAISSIGRSQGVDLSGDVEMHVLTATTELATEIATSQEDESTELAPERPSLQGGPSQNTEADESRTDDEGRIVPRMVPLEAGPTAMITTSVVATQGPTAENVNMHEEAAPVVGSASDAFTDSLPDALPRAQSSVRSLLQPIVAVAANLLPVALQPTVAPVEESQVAAIEEPPKAATEAEPLDPALPVKPTATASPAKEAPSVQRGLTNSSAGDTDAVDALTQSAPAVVSATVGADDDIVADSQPPSRTRSQHDLGIDLQAEAGGSLSVSQMPLATPRLDSSPAARTRHPTPPPTTKAPPPLPSDEPEIVDLRSASPEISIISPPSSLRPADPAAARSAVISNGNRPPAGSAPSSIASQAATSIHLPPPPRPPPPPPPPPAPAPRQMPAFQPPKPSFTLSRTLDLPQHHGLPMYDDVMEILRRAQAYQNRRSR